MFALKRIYSKGFQRNILHKDKPCFSATVVCNMAASSGEMMPFTAILSTKETASRYRIIRARNSLSALSGIEVTSAAAELAVFVPICNKLLSAMPTDKCVVGLLVDFVLVAVPVGHPAPIRAELFLFTASGLFNGFSALQAYAGSRYLRVAAYV